MVIFPSHFRHHIFLCWCVHGRAAWTGKASTVWYLIHALECRLMTFIAIHVSLIPITLLDFVTEGEMPHKYTCEMFNYLSRLSIEILKPIRPWCHIKPERIRSHSRQTVNAAAATASSMNKTSKMAKCFPWRLSQCLRLWFICCRQEWSKPYVFVPAAAQSASLPSLCPQ